jgi:glucosamine-6-phosphate deaminase
MFRGIYAKIGEIRRVPMTRKNKCILIYITVYDNILDTRNLNLLLGVIELITFYAGKLKVQVYKTVELMARAAADNIRDIIKSLLNEKNEINIVFSGALSQQAFHQELAKLKDIDWQRINVFSVDEFYCPEMNEEYTVAQQPIRDLYSVVKPKSINVINYKAPDPEEERRRYETLIKNNPPDIACLGIGISGHVALNEPGQTDFNDKLSVRLVDVVDESKKQLMNDPNFMKQGFIPDKGITITLSELIKCRNVLVVVPYAEKAEIMRKFFECDVTPDLPASILKEKENAVMYMDESSYGGVVE